MFRVYKNRSECDGNLTYSYHPKHFGSVFMCPFLCLLAQCKCRKTPGRVGKSTPRKGHVLGSNPRQTQILSKDLLILARSKRICPCRKVVTHRFRFKAEKDKPTLHLSSKDIIGAGPFKEGNDVELIQL